MSSKIDQPTEHALILASLVGLIWRTAYDAGQEDFEKGFPGGPQRAWEAYGTFDENVCRLRKEIMAKDEDSKRLDWIYLTASGIQWQTDQTRLITRDSIDAAFAEAMAEEREDAKGSTFQPMQKNTDRGKEFTKCHEEFVKEWIKPTT